MTTRTPAHSPTAASLSDGRHSQLYAETMHSEQWRRRRARAIRRAGGKCQRCGSTERLEAHHLTYVRLGREKPADLIVLCHACHQAEHSPHPDAGASFGRLVRAIRQRISARKRRR